jgi:heme-degrading monooxygenase HmoA
MISRIVDCTVRNGKLNEFTNKLTNSYVPRIKSQPGFVDIVESVDPETGHFVCMTLWKTPQDVERYDNSLFQEVAQGLSPLMIEPPQVSTLMVETSSIHRIQRGSAQAA